MSGIQAIFRTTEPSRRMSRIAASALIGAALTGCAVGPHLPPPTIPQPARYTQKALPQKIGGQQRLRWSDQAYARWWTTFASPGLDRIVDQVLQHNPDLAADRASLARAKALVAAAQGGLMPSIGANLGADRSKALRTGADGGSQYKVPGNLYSLILGTVSVQYNPDVFGGQEDLVHAAKARAEVQSAQLRQAQIFVIAATMNAAIDGAQAQAQLQAAQHIARADERLLTLLRAEYKLGYQNLQNVEQQQAITDAAQARLAPLEASVSAARHALDALRGSMPNRPVNLPALKRLHLPQNIPVVVPSALLKTRPDIEAARAEVRVASANADVATANLYPQLDITGSIGKAAQTGMLFFNPVSTLWSLGAALVAPIYEGGALTAERQAAMDAYHEAANRYRATVFDAFRQTADALRALQSAHTAYKHSKASAKAAAKALKLAVAKYRDGVVDYNALLNAEIAYQEDTVAAIKARSTLYLDNVALFVAMGEGPDLQVKPHEDGNQRPDTQVQHHPGNRT